MDVRVVDLVEIFPKPLHEWLQRPYGQFFRIDRLRYLPDVARHLSIAKKVVEELRIGRAEYALDQGAESGLCRWPRLLGAFVAGQQRLEIGAVEFRAAIHDQALRQAAVPANALPQHHHARAIARLLEVQMNGQDAARKRID